MKKGMIIKSNLRDLLSVLDARAFVTIFTSEKDHYSTMPVMEFLCDAELMRLNGDRTVTGIAVMIGSITIQLEY